MARKRKLTRKQQNELPNIGIALGTGLLASQVQRVAEEKIPFLAENPNITSAFMGLVGAGMVFLGSDKLNPAGYALLGSSGYDMSDDITSTAVQGISRLTSEPVQGISRLESMQGARILAEEEEFDY
jgi:predicted heme/steroid binding protein